jgi:hypothetical protein
LKLIEAINPAKAHFRPAAVQAKARAARIRFSAGVQRT